MARPREFDPAKALDEAMHVFWKKGYTATSVEDLVEATGVNRYGLYDVFDSKRGLFLAALEYYRRTVVTEAIQELERPGASIAAIHAVFERIIRRARTGEAKYGCLLCNTAEEVAPFDPEAAREVTTYQRRLIKAFRAAVREAQHKGELTESIDPAEMGRYLAGLIQGASYLARSPSTNQEVEDFVHVGLRVLG